jgi:hypothetical protein
MGSSHRTLASNRLHRVRHSGTLPGLAWEGTMKSFDLRAALCTASKSITPLVTLLLIAALAVGCSSASDTDLTPEGEIGAGSLNGADDGTGTTPGGDGLTPGEGSSTPTCGDGNCDPGEHTFNCRADCAAGEYLLCLTTACPETVQGCSASARCGDALVCLSQCDPDAEADVAEVCRSGCAANLDEGDAAAFQLVLDCEADSTCRPDGPPPVVDPEVDPTLSCAGECGEPASSERPCACDASCVIFSDCCDDYEAACVDAPATGCGDGVCGDDEDPASCPGDCGDAPPVGVCGDGECDEGEGPNSCPEDCAGDPPAPMDVLACLGEACPSEYESCLDDEACVEVLDCIAECPPADQNCLFGCSQLGGFSMTAINVGLCGQESGCFDEMPAGPECGDGVCAEGEDPMSCPADCEDGPEPPDLADCLNAECPDEMAACLGDESCMQALECLQGCPAGDQGCLFDCSQVGGFSMPAINLGICGQSSGCFDGGPACGDGVCDWDAGEDGGNCPVDCGGEPPTGEGCIWEECGPEVGACMANPACGALIECVQDCESNGCVQGCANEAGEEAVGLYNQAGDCYDENCADEGFCGDGDCGPGENPDICPQDCGGGNPGNVSDCLEDNCGAEYAACVNDAACLEALNCIEGCPADDFGCLFGCSQAAGFSQTAIDVGLCGQGAGCFSGGGGNGPQCGNGICEDGEGPNSCPQDCGGGTIVISATVECIIDECNVGAQCQGSETCLGAIECIAECSNEGCVDNCVDAMQGGGQNYIANQVAPCALDSGCLEGGAGPVDPPGTDLEGCLTDNCAPQWNACMGDAACAGALPCLNECVEGGGTGCTYQCMPDQENDALLALGTCGGQNGCGNICGDGECDPGETADSCPEDCSNNGGGDNSGFECLSDNCPDSVEKCTDSDCWSIFSCYEGCDDQDDCLNGCFFSASDDAQAASQEIGQCWEDNDCENGGGGDNGGGDETDDYWQCIETSCEQQFNTCYTNGSQTCPATFNCADQCIEDGGSADECLPSCYESNDGSDSNTTTTLYECSADANCHGGGDNGGGDNGGGDNGGGDPNVDDFVECVTDVCEAEVTACEANAQCADVLDCALACAGDIGCMIGCAGFEALSNSTIVDVGTCAQASGCI